ncbi:MAG TPA: hypothetical protein VGG94_05865 [Chthoniobacterales bacterium]
MSAGKRSFAACVLFVIAALSITAEATTAPVSNPPVGDTASVPGTPDGMLAASPAVDAKKPATPTAPVDQLIPWLLGESGQLREIPLSEVIFDTTGKHVLPVDLKNDVDRRVIKQISEVMEEVVRTMNAPESPVQRIPRINEVSSHFEDLLRQLLNARPGLSCDFPRTAAGKIQRSGYPDLRIVDQASHRVFYLDPKLYAVGSRDGSFRTFYFEPKVATNKVRDDAVHLIAGFEHEERKDNQWKFTRWDLVDLSKFKVKLKAEFQGSNRDMYRPEAIVATSQKP